MYNHDTKRIITFLLWLRDKVLILVSLSWPFAHYSPIQRHPDREEDLFNRHLVAIDNWFHSQLDNYPHSYCVSQILAAGTLTGFMSQDIVSVLGPDPNSRSRRSDPLQIYTPQAEYQEFYGILCQFLTDPVRSGKWCVDGSRYAVLAIFFLLFLRHEWVSALLTDIVPHLRKRHWDKIDKFALDLLPNILKKATNIPELEKVLQNHPLRTPQSKTHRPSTERSNVTKAMKEYWDVRVLTHRLILSDADLLSILLETYVV